jgi:DivIVA domain-containing protein
MRCRECAAEVAVTARACSRCGAPIVGQPPVVAHTVTDTMVGAVSDAAGKAVPASVAGQTPPEPYVPGSGDKLPAELRLVLGGYAGIACLSAGALALPLAATAVAIYFDIYLDKDPTLAYAVAVVGSCLWCILGDLLLEALQAPIRFSRPLRRRSDPRTATVTASKRGGRALILDIIPRDGTGRRYQSLSEVPLALWTKADMLVPGETVNVYGGSGKGSKLFISSPQRGRALLGTVESQSALQPRLLDEKVSGATLVNWAAWAASTTFSSTAGLLQGYDKREVDAFRSVVRDTFLGGAVFCVSTPPVRSDEVRGKQFSTHGPGYDKTEVDAFLEAAGLTLAAMESTDRPAGPLVSGPLLVEWAEWAESTRFSSGGYEAMEVDTFKEAIRDTFLGVRKSPVRSDKVRGRRFSSSDGTHPGYDKKQVAAFLDAAGIRLAAMESADRPAVPLVSGAILAGWAEWADSTTFSTRRRSDGYDKAEVDAFVEGIRDEFLGVRRTPLPWHAAHGKQFTTARPGYDVEQVDAFLDKAESRLAAMRATDKGAT